MSCYCGSEIDFSACCEPLHKKTKQAETAEQLMRARYSAYVTADIDFLHDTLAPEARHDFDSKAAKQWAKQAKWQGLQILSTDKGNKNDSVGTVEFIATYHDGKEALDHHETSQFRKDNKTNSWYFVDGDAHTHPAGQGHHHHEKPQTVVRGQPKIGRNDPCSCGSGKKYKKCHGADE